LSESNDKSQDVPRLRLAWRSLERREFRLRDTNDESLVLARLEFAHGSLERAGKILNWAQKGVARLSDGWLA